MERIKDNICRPVRSGMDRDYIGFMANDNFIVGRPPTALNTNIQVK